MTTNPSGQSPIDSPEVAATFSSYDAHVRPDLLSLRQLILDTAAETAGVGRVEEALRWGQPSYLTTGSRSGSTIRIAPIGAGVDHDYDYDYDYAMFFICGTNLVESFKDLFGDVMDYDGNRALMFSVNDQRPEPELRACITMALTYHLTKK